MTQQELIDTLLHRRETIITAANGRVAEITDILAMLGYPEPQPNVPVMAQPQPAPEIKEPQKEVTS